MDPKNINRRLSSGKTRRIPEASTIEEGCFSRFAPYGCYGFSCFIVATTAIGDAVAVNVSFENDNLALIAKISVIER